MKHKPQFKGKDKCAHPQGHFSGKLNEGRVETSGVGLLRPTSKVGETLAPLTFSCQSKTVLASPWHVKCASRQTSYLFTQRALTESSHQPLVVSATGQTRLRLASNPRSTQHWGSWMLWVTPPAWPMKPHGDAPLKHRAIDAERLQSGAHSRPGSGHMRVLTFLVQQRDMRVTPSASTLTCWFWSLIQLLRGLGSGSLVKNLGSPLLHHLHIS